ncbi:hypothetical protein B296_00055871 [Ensete ventricosum]|uniref:Secreted protein n=1 Tax=Ensete ventricosum TaxID=4639 RepID=A0A426XXW9_ENSVE|nr:hypothetical protein B296_00055871 [Ensete ventricosum]
MRSPFSPSIAVSIATCMTLLASTAAIFCYHISQCCFFPITVIAHICPPTAGPIHITFPRHCHYYTMPLQETPLLASPSNVHYATVSLALLLNNYRSRVLNHLIPSIATAASIATHATRITDLDCP